MGECAGLSHEDLLSMFINLNKPLCAEFYIIANKIKIDSFNLIQHYLFILHSVIIQIYYTLSGDK